MVTQITPYACVRRNLRYVRDHLFANLLFVGSIGLASTPKEQKGRRRVFASMLVVSLLATLALCGFILYFIYELFNSAP